MTDDERLGIANRAAFKLWTGYVRGEVSPKSEYDDFITAFYPQANVRTLKWEEKQCDFAFVVRCTRPLGHLGDHMFDTLDPQPRDT